jgi:flagellar FliJ protein
MSRLKKMAPILELAERGEHQAAQALGAGRQRLESACSALDNLQGFRSSYAGRFEQAGRQGLSVHRLNEFRSFLHKINKAIAEQERTIQQIETEIEALRRVWEEAHRKVLGMQKLVAKLSAAEQAQEQKREQVEQDDRVGSRRGNGGKSLLSLLV